MRTIESEIHNILLDLAPDAHDLEDQAKIVAAATDLYECTVANFKKNTIGRTASQNPEKLREAQIVDSLFQAMDVLDNWQSTDVYTKTSVDGRGLDPHQIVQAAASTIIGMRSAKYDCKGMEIINDDELNDFFGKTEGLPSQKYFIDDAEENHDPELYHLPGQGTHRSDYLSR